MIGANYTSLLHFKFMPSVLEYQSISICDCNKTKIIKVLLREQRKHFFQIKKSLNPENLEDLKKSGKIPEKSGDRMKFQKRRLSYQI